ncbi:MAG: hypothetical protein [Caudoviricetes sp.]|nr:MAG: hypothetical protein [Caudoviricetes sp.]
MFEKPSWETDAPSWANYLAADVTTDPEKPEYWVWFKYEPIFDRGTWLCGEGSGRWDQSKFPVPLGFDCKNSLESRPC